MAGTESLVSLTGLDTHSPLSSKENLEKTSKSNILENITKIDKNNAPENKENIQILVQCKTISNGDIITEAELLKYMASTECPTKENMLENIVEEDSLIMVYDKDVAKLEKKVNEKDVAEPAEKVFMTSEKHSNANVLEIQRSCLWRQLWADNGQCLPDQRSRFWDQGIHSENIPLMMTNHVAQQAPANLRRQKG